MGMQVTYSSGLCCKWLATRLLGLFVVSLPPLGVALIAVWRVVFRFSLLMGFTNVCTIRVEALPFIETGIERGVGVEAVQSVGLGEEEVVWVLLDGSHADGSRL